MPEWEEEISLNKVGFLQDAKIKTAKQQIIGVKILGM